MNQRNGTRDRLLTTKAGDVALKIPTLRKGSFFPSILEPRRHIDRAVFAVMEAYVHGVSTRKVETSSPRSAPRRGSPSARCPALRRPGRGDGCMARPSLDHVEFPYVDADATSLKGRVGGQVVSRAVVVVTGITATGEREVLACAVGDTETEAFWAETFRSRRARGLAGVRRRRTPRHHRPAQAPRQLNQTTMRARRRTLLHHHARRHPSLPRSV